MSNTRPGEKAINLRLRSTLADHHFPSVLDNRSAQLLAWQWQFERSERLCPKERATAQFAQLSRVIQHHRQHSKFFATRLAQAGLTDVTDWNAALLSRLPLLTRDNLQQADADFWSALPPAHGEVAENETTGSTGQTLRIRRSSANQIMWNALTLREHIWWDLNEGGRLAVIRDLHNGEPLGLDGRVNSWGGSISWLFKTGPAFAKSIKSGMADITSWLQRVNPHYLLLYPSVLSALLDTYESAGLPKPAALRLVRTMAETVTPALRERCRALWGCEIADVYSSQECGVIAVQCPTSGLMHAMAESLLVEVINEQGQACAPGETGRLVISDLHNFATPLIRYELRDHAVLADTACSCGRTLPTFSHILGRTRNMVTLPDGRKIWPAVGHRHWHDIIKVRQFQFIQKTLHRMIVRLWLDEPMTQEQEQRFTAVLKQTYHQDMSFEFLVFFSELPRGPGGKFEEVISEVI